MDDEHDDDHGWCGFLLGFEELFPFFSPADDHFPTSNEMNENELLFLLSHLATGCLVVAGYLETSGVVIQCDC
jgi:hypothetical protein